MKIFPAIDLRDGNVVMLNQGDFSRSTTYSNNPENIATEYINKGATNLHIVDLDGARDGKLMNFPVIEKLANSGLSVQVGGGIRDEDRIKKYLDIGVKRVILGTVAAENPDFVIDMVSKYNDAIAVGVDSINGKVAVNAWVNVTDIDAIAFCKKLDEIGVGTIIFTDITKDGMLSGIDAELYKNLCSEVNTNIIASGGVTTLDDVKTLSEIGVYGAIIGKALYNGNIILEEAIKIYEK